MSNVSDLDFSAEVEIAIKRRITFWLLKLVSDGYLQSMETNGRLFFWVNGTSVPPAAPPVRKDYENE